MALQKDITLLGSGTLTNGAEEMTVTDVSIVMANCYIKVERVDASKDTATAVVSFKGTVDDINPVCEKKYNFNPSLDGDNFIRQAYLHLKGLPQFSDAEDV